MSLTSGKEIILEITGLGSSGEGIGAIDGLKVFVEGALPGEQVRVQVTVAKARYAKGDLLEILKPSPHRTEPPCPLFDRCGGCQLQHVAYAQQLEMKRARVIDALERIGGFKGVTVAPCEPSPSPLAYRNKIQLPVVTGPNGTLIGLYRRHSHDVIPVDRCLIHCDLGETVYRDVQQLIQESGLKPYCTRSRKGDLRHLLIKSAIHTGEVLVALVTTGRGPAKALAEKILSSIPAVKGVIENINARHDNVILGSRYRTLAGENAIHETLCGLTFKVSAASFFQVNTDQAEQLYTKALELAELDATTTLLDAYCGVGTLALIAAKHVQRVVGIECVPQAITDAKENGERNGIENATFICGNAETAIRDIGAVDVALLNPPRKGCDPALLNELIAHPPQKIIYVSCDPATLARDLAILVKGGFSLQSTHPFDMFPQTSHVETIVKLRHTRQP